MIRARARPRIIDFVDRHQLTCYFPGQANTVPILNLAPLKTHRIQIRRPNMPQFLEFTVESITVRKGIIHYTGQDRRCRKYLVQSQPPPTRGSIFRGLSTAATAALRYQSLRMQAERLQSDRGIRRWTGRSDPASALHCKDSYGASITTRFVGG